jgi:hypothetical protein
MPLPVAIENFIKDMRAHRDYAAFADGFAAAFEAIDVEGDYNNHAGAFIEAVGWVVGHRDRSVGARIEMVDKLRSLKGFNVINMREFTGWE